MNDFEEINLLLDFYEKLLTQNQIEVMEWYYRENYSLNEIAEIKGVSKSAIHDSLQRSVKLLKDYEQKLELVDKFNQRNKIYSQLEKKEDIKEEVKKLKNID